MAQKNLTCIICPLSCPLEVSYTEETSLHVTDVKGNTCPRGEQYAKKELLNPTRTLTTTIAVQGGECSLVSVKTEHEIPKDMLFASMEVIRRAVVCAPVTRGDVLIRDLLGTGIGVVACADVACAELSQS